MAAPPSKARNHSRGHIRALPSGSLQVTVYTGVDDAAYAEAGYRAPRAFTTSLWPQDERGLLDLESLLKDPEDNTLVYCCGPEGLLNAVEQQCACWPLGILHIERFAAKAPTAEQAAEALERFEVVCHRSGVTLEVTSDMPILEALEAADVPILASC
jgi:ferredoxin-NADP reductase